MPSPLDLFAAWPPERRLFALISTRPHERWSHTSLLAEPGEITKEFPVGCVSDAPRTTSRDRKGAVSPSHGERTVPTLAPSHLGFLSYELGHTLEPAAGPPHPSTWLDALLAPIPNALIHDSLTNTWSSRGTPPISIDDLPGNWGRVRSADHVTSHAPELHPSRVSYGSPSPWTGAVCEPPSPRLFTLTPFIPSLPEDQYLSIVRQTIDHIHRGDIYQANITQPLHATFRGNPRDLARAAFVAAQPWFGAYLELEDGRVLISLSPELFLHFDASTRIITTRPIKGTLPASRTPAELLNSAKDRAELTMIVDLMRNDLGRICDTGSIRVEQPREIETHPTVHHGVATITGRVRDEVTFEEILRATFPPGSITGAPKIRAMQIIRELEPTPRGPYCGSIIHTHPNGSFTASVAIRTLLLTPRDPVVVQASLPASGNLPVYDITYNVGGGITADSDPHAELAECHAKAAVVNQLVCNSPTLEPVVFPEQ